MGQNPFIEGQRRTIILTPNPAENHPFDSMWRESKSMKGGYMCRNPDMLVDQRDNYKVRVRILRPTNRTRVQNGCMGSCLSIADGI